MRENTTLTHNYHCYLNKKVKAKAAPVLN